MASGAFFDLNTALRLAPVITASATVTFVGNLQWIYELFTRAELAAKDKTFLPRWFNTAFWIGMPKVLGLVTASAIGAVLNIRSNPGDLKAKGAYAWYFYGAVLSAAHLLFIPAAVARTKEIAEDAKGDGQSVEEMKGWLRVNALRTLTVDTGAWICFVIATVKALGPA
ncbi:hypothetical protein B0T16DRAFT_338532 [Cercophora newfieldiana]|uniref:Uncharacterized protein n=1 Tax=Cercophora newfieldiana TaxID=92897 RepID=A0AA39XTZ1_9PEZI|nr:hypothetical protein B0T16DRAFT_338532 [Cercophora newfieldiana]